MTIASHLTPVQTTPQVIIISPSTLLPTLTRKFASLKITIENSLCFQLLLPCSSKNQNALHMKKVFLGLMALSMIVVSCNNDESKTDDKDSSGTAKTDEAPAKKLTPEEEQKAW